MKTYSVQIPIGGHAIVTVDAEDEDSAIELAMENLSIENIENWEPLHKVNQGNVCYFPRPWEIEVSDETIGED